MTNTIPRGDDSNKRRLAFQHKTSSRAASMSSLHQVYRNMFRLALEQHRTGGSKP